MLTRYHAGKADEVESDVASTDRFGVVNFAKYEGDGKTGAPGPHRYRPHRHCGRGRP